MYKGPSHHHHHIKHTRFHTSCASHFLPTHTFTLSRPPTMKQLSGSPQSSCEAAIYIAPPYTALFPVATTPNKLL